MTAEKLACLLIQAFEGCRLEAYQDQGGVWTIGYGHTFHAYKGQKVTPEVALGLLAEDIAPLLLLVINKPVIEAAALVSFGYNCGQGALRRVLSGESHVYEFIHVKGAVAEGLVRRRALEEGLIETSRVYGA